MSWLSHWLRRYADSRLASENATLASENAELRARQVTLFGAIRDWWRRKIAAHADVQLRRRVLQLEAHVQSLQSRCDSQFGEIVDLNAQLRQAIVDSTRAGRGQHMTRGPFKATAAEFINQERYRK